MKKSIALLLLIATALSLLAGCNNTSSNSTTTPTTSANSTTGTTSSGTTAPEEKPYKHFRFANGGESFTLYSVKNMMATGSVLLNLISPGLVAMRDNEVYPYAAESYEVSADGLTWTFHLRENHWEDGVPVTAHDFEFTYKHWADPNTGTSNAGAWLNFIVNARALFSEKSITDPEQLGVKAIDDKTFEIYLSDPCPYFPILIATSSNLCPMRKDILEKHGTDYASSPQTLISCGPFKVTEWVHDSEIVLERRYDYPYDEDIHLDKITQIFVTDPGTVANMYAADELDYAFSISAEYIDTFPGEVESNLGTGMRALVMNAWYAPPELIDLFNNKNFRMALSYAIDREALVNVIEPGVGSIPYNRMVAPFILGVKDMYVDEYPLDIVSINGDKEKAKAYLAAALEELGLSSVDKLPTFELQTFEGTVNRGYGEALIDTWNQVLGITTIQLTQMPTMTLFGLMSEHTHQMVTFPGASSVDPYTTLSGWYNPQGNAEYSGWTDEAMFRRVEASNRMSDNAERLAVLAEAEQLLLDESSFIPLLMSSTASLKKDYVSGISRSLSTGTVLINWVDINQ